MTRDNVLCPERASRGPKRAYIDYQLGLPLAPAALRHRRIPAGLKGPGEFLIDFRTPNYSEPLGNDRAAVIASDGLDGYIAPVILAST
jgi:hypothetical protein